MDALPQEDSDQDIGVNLINGPLTAKAAVKYLTVVSNWLRDTFECLDISGTGVLDVSARADQIEQSQAEKYRVDPGTFVRIDIADEGQGIPPGDLEKIFDPFFTTKEHGVGTGLGLASTFNIVRNHKGFITVESEVDKGTRFTIYLPAQSVQRQTKRA